MVECPSCKEKSIKWVNAIFSTKGSPLLCSSCGTDFYVKRPFTNLYVLGVWASGIGFLLLIFAFSEWGKNGVISGILISFALAVIFSSIEIKVFGLNTVEHESVSAFKKRAIVTIGILVLFIGFLYVLSANT